MSVSAWTYRERRLHPAVFHGGVVRQSLNPLFDCVAHHGLPADVSEPRSKLEWRRCDLPTSGAFGEGGLRRLALDETLDDVSINRFVKLLEIEQHEQGGGQPLHVVDESLHYRAHGDNDFTHRLVRRRGGGRPDEPIPASAGELAPSESPVRHPYAEPGLGRHAKGAVQIRREHQALGHPDDASVEKDLLLITVVLKEALEQVVIAVAPQCPVVVRRAPAHRALVYRDFRTDTVRMR